MKERLLLGLLLGLSIGCAPGGGGGGGPGVSPEGQAKPREFLGDPKTLPPGPPQGSATLVAELDFDSEAPFVDPIPEEARAKNFTTGEWKVVNGRYQQESEAPSTTLSVRKYDGNAFGGGGRMPTRYRVEALGWQYRWFGVDEAMNPGKIFLIPYWRNEQSYLILSASPKVAEGWIAREVFPGNPWPGELKIWRTDWKKPRRIGEAVNLAADVDTEAGTVTFYLNGEPQGTFARSFITNAAHSFALASNGNQVRYEWASSTGLRAARRQDRAALPTGRRSSAIMGKIRLREDAA